MLYGTIQGNYCRGCQAGTQGYGTNLPFRHSENGLQGQRTLADTWFSAQQDDAAWYQSASQNTVQFSVMHINARFVLPRDITQSHGAVFTACRCLPDMRGSRAGSLLSAVVCNPDFLERVPLSAGRAFSYPFCRFLSAVLADIGYLVFCHTADKITKL